jgi:hypothetical protein
MVITSAAANLLFKIPAGDANHEVVACQTVPRDIQVINYMPHMHLRGKDFKYDVIYPDGKTETISGDTEANRLLSREYRKGWTL